MELKRLFLKANNELENSGKGSRDRKVACRKCGRKNTVTRIRNNNFICPDCGHYFQVRARRRILMLTDRRSFIEMNREMRSENILAFPEYDDKLRSAMDKSRENEGVICGEAEIDGHKICIFSMDSNFMMGSMGAVVGEKITSLFEYATLRNLPVLGITVSGGARMQEGMISLMQMSKVSAAVKRHSNAGNLYIVLLTNPTTGGVDASFAMLGDIHIAEPEAIIAFTGPRVIEGTIREKLPEGFQKSEYLLNHGMVDMVIERKDLKETIARILGLLTHKKY